MYFQRRYEGHADSVASQDLCATQSSVSYTSQLSHNVPLTVTLPMMPSNSKDSNFLQSKKTGEALVCFTLKDSNGHSFEESFAFTTFTQILTDSIYGNGEILKEFAKEHAREYAHGHFLSNPTNFAQSFDDFATELEALTNEVRTLVKTAPIVIIVDMESDDRQCHMTLCELCKELGMTMPPTLCQAAERNGAPYDTLQALLRLVHEMTGNEPQPDPNHDEWYQEGQMTIMRGASLEVPNSEQTLTAARELARWVAIHPDHRTFNMANLTSLITFQALPDDTVRKMGISFNAVPYVKPITGPCRYAGNRNFHPDSYSESRKRAMELGTKFIGLHFSLLGCTAKLQSDIPGWETHLESKVLHPEDSQSNGYFNMLQNTKWMAQYDCKLKGVFDQVYSKWLSSEIAEVLKGLEIPAGVEELVGLLTQPKNFPVGACGSQRREVWADSVEYPINGSAGDLARLPFLLHIPPGSFVLPVQFEEERKRESTNSKPSNDLGDIRVSFDNPTDYTLLEVMTNRSWTWLAGSGNGIMIKCNQERGVANTMTRLTCLLAKGSKRFKQFRR